MLEPAELGQPELEVRELRNDLRDTCAAVVERLDLLLIDTGSLDADLLDLLEATQAGNADGKAIAEALAGVVEVSAPTGVEVSNPPDTEAIKQAVVDANETSNQNAWGIFGVIVGFLSLAGLYKLVRP